MKLGLRETLFIALMLGLLGGSYWFGFRKAEQRREALRQDTARMQVELHRLREATHGVEDLNTRLDELQEALVFFEQKLPSAKDVDAVLSDVTAAAARNGLTVEKFEELRVRVEPNYSEQPIRMNLTGTFEGFYEFMLALEKLPRITRVTDLELKRINSTGNDPMQATLDLSVFFEPGK